MAHEDYKAMLPAYALAALDHDDGLELGKHLSSCADCRVELDAWHDTAGAIAYAAPPLEPSIQLRERILETVRREAKPTENVIPFSRQRGRAAASRFRFEAIAAVIIVGALIIGLVVLWRRNQAAQTEVAKLSTEIKTTQDQLAREREVLQLLTRPDTRVAELVGTKDAPRAYAVIAVDSQSGRAVLVANGLPPAPAGKAYQLWFIAGAQPIPGSTFQTDAAGQVTLRDQLPASALKATVFAVTLEPQGGVPAPTGHLYLLTPAPQRAS